MKIQPTTTSPTFQYNSPLKTLWRKGELPVRYGFYGDRLTQKNVSLEHLKPHSKGGKTELSNLVLEKKKKNMARGNVDIRNFANKEAIAEHIGEFYPFISVIRSVFTKRQSKWRMHCSELHARVLRLCGYKFPEDFNMECTPLELFNVLKK